LHLHLTDQSLTMKFIILASLFVLSVVAEAEPEAEPQHFTSGFVQYPNGAITPDETDSVKAVKAIHANAKLNAYSYNLAKGFNTYPINEMNNFYQQKGDAMEDPRHFYHAYFPSNYPSTYSGYPYTYHNDVNMYMKNAMPLRQTLQSLKRPVAYPTNYQTFYPNAVYNWGQSEVQAPVVQRQSGIQAPVAQRRFVREAESDAEAQYSHFYSQTYPNAFTGFHNTFANDKIVSNTPYAYTYNPFYNTWANNHNAYTPYTNMYSGYPYTTYNYGGVYQY